MPFLGALLVTLAAASFVYEGPSWFVWVSLLFGLWAGFDEQEKFK